MFRFIATLRRLFKSVSANADDEPRADESLDTDSPFPEVVPLEIRESIDLHTIPPRDIPAVVAEYLCEARARGFKSVRIIHGKGTGTQRAIVRRILADTDFIGDFTDAAPHSGGWGATVARLRVTPPTPHED